MNTRALINEFLNSGRARGLANKTVHWYGCMLDKFCRRWKELPEEPAAVEAFLGAITAGDETRHAYYRTLRAFYRWAAGRHDIHDPIAPLKPNQKPQVRAPIRRRKVPYSLSVTELAWLLATPGSARDRTLVNLLVDTGLRIGEALGLTREDIQEEFILVNGKTGEREVPLSGETRRQMLQLVARGPVFVGEKGRLTESGAYRIIKTALARAGIKARKRGPHVLRHTFGRQYIMAGGDLVSLQRIMGHTDIKTTKIYAELDLRDITDQHRRFTPLKTALAGSQAVLWSRPGGTFHNDQEVVK
jgi:site-specific recombinase XerD